MSLTLAPGLSFVEQDGKRVFLDLTHDRYLALDESADCAFTALAHGKPDEDQRALLLGLVDANILVDLPFGENPRPCRQVALITSALDEMQLAPPSTWKILIAGWAIVRAKRALRRRSLASNVERVRALKESTSADIRRAEPGEREAIAAAFSAAGRLISTLDQCLALSFAMTRHCLGANLDTELSIGVKLRPFEAHAWVSVEGILVSDRLDTVRPFATILEV